MKILKTESDTIFVIYDPARQRLRVGGNFRVVDEADGTREEYLTMVVEDSVPELPGILEGAIREEIYPKPEQELGVEPKTKGATERLKLAKFKILGKIIGSRVRTWDGSVPSRTAKLELLPTRGLLELLELGGSLCSSQAASQTSNQVVKVPEAEAPAPQSASLPTLQLPAPRVKHPAKIGHVTDEARAYDVISSCYHLEGINLIVGVKGMGKSHLAKTILVDFINQGFGTIVFDLNNEYSGIKTLVKDDKLDVLRPTDNLKFTLPELGPKTLIDIMEGLGLSEPSLMDFRSIVTDDKGNLDVKTIEDLEKKVRGLSTRQTASAIQRRLVKLKPLLTNEEGKMGEIVTKLNDGNCFLVNLRALDHDIVRCTVQALISILTSKLESQDLKPIAIMAEEAHSYIQKEAWTDIVTRTRHLGATHFYITNSPRNIPELILRQADNLFCFHLDLPEDIKYVAPASGLDDRTLEKIVKALMPHQFLAVGSVTRGYPLVLETCPELRGVAAGETRRKFNEP